jgi:membrane protein required for colicin V production
VQLAVAFFALLLLTRIVGSLVASAARWAGLGPVDRVAGLALGVVRALLVLAVCALATERFGLTGHPSFERSLSRPLLVWLIERAEPYWDQEFSIPQTAGG